jgi:signal transduction histidine kinase
MSSETGARRQQRSIGALVLGGVALALLAIAFLIAINATRSLAASSAWVDHTTSVRRDIAEIGRSILFAESSQRGYVLTGNAEYLAPYGRATANAQGEIEHVRALTTDNPRQLERVADLDRLVHLKMSEMQEVLDARDRDGLSAAIAVINTNRGFNTMTKVHATLDAMRSDEEQLLAAPRERQQRDETITIGALVATSVLFGVFVMSAFVWVRTAQRRNDAAEATAARLRAENAALAERERTAKFQEQFIAVLGHDLRNPLSSMRLGVRMLKQLPASTHAVTIERIENSAVRMARMIDQILDLTRARLGGGIPLSRAPLDLGKLVTEVATEAALAHGARVELAQVGALDGSWDGDRLGQVVSNLVGNACSYRADGTPVNVTVQGDGATVRIKVHNQGPPIAEDLRRVLFDPFRRGERDTKSAQAAGLGLGLYITHEIITAHGGHIEVESSAAAGTTFTVDLPRKPTGTA